MSYRVRVYPTGRRLGPASESLLYETATEAEAVVLGTAQLSSAPRSAEPFVFEVFDPGDRLVLSYTSEVRPWSEPVEESVHPSQP